MPYSIHITDQNFNPIAATVIYSDASGKVLGSQAVPAAGGLLDANMLNQAATVTFTAPGYYDFYTATAQIFEGSTDITLDKQPTSTLEIILITAAAAFAAVKIFKL